MKFLSADHLNHVFHPSIRIDKQEKPIAISLSQTVRERWFMKRLRIWRWYIEYRLYFDAHSSGANVCIRTSHGRCDIDLLMFCG